MNNTKTTKRENYEALLTLLVNALNADLITEEEDARLAEFLNHEVAQLDKRAESAKKYAKAKAKASDAMTDAIMAVMTKDAQTTAEIVAKVLENDAECEITNQKATYRLSKLVDAGTLTRETKTIKNEDKGSRRVTFYALADAE